MKQKVAIVVSVVFPGIGQVILGRPINGLFLFAAYGFFLLLALFRLLAFEMRSLLDDRILCLAIGGAAASWTCALIETLRLGIARRSERTKAARDEHIRNGIVHYLKGEFGRAASEFRKALALDRNDGDARFHLAMVLKAQGLRHQAKRALKKCLALDPDSKWSAGIYEELENLSS